MTIELKERFVKDMGLPIKIFEEPYFENLLRLFEFENGAYQKYCRFKELVKSYKSVDEFFKDCYEFREKAIEYLNQSPEMLYFSQNEDMSKYGIVNKGFPANEIYKETFDGEFFVSIDMIKGNFTALRHYNPLIVGGKNTYEEFAGMFTDIPYLIESKYLRQVIFGNVNPKRQVTYEKYLMDKVLTRLFEKGFSKESVVFFNTDEIVLKVSEENVIDGVVRQEFCQVVESVVAEMVQQNINVRFEVFQLRKIPGSMGYVKKFQYNKFGHVFKKVNHLEYPFVLRAYNGEKYQDIDCVFLYEGKKAMLLDIPQITVV